MSGVLGKYRLDQRLGGGGMAEVFLASTVGAEGFSRKVAIKRVLPGFSENESFARMFVDEARISSQLAHPNIVSVLDFDRDPDGRLYLVMELVEGKDLDALVATGPLPFAVIIFVIIEVLRGLGHAHDLPAGNQARGIVHRDVSPHNVLLSWTGAIKVSDFGIAKARETSEATASWFVKGKPAYMSPEQANGQPLDGRSDLFAVGIMLWEMLVGRRLFVAEDTRATLAAVMFGQITRPRALRPEVPADLEYVAMKLLERELSMRYATAEEAVRDLLECADAPKAGRELLVATLGARFPGEMPVRQSLLRMRSSNPEAPPAPGWAAPPRELAQGTPTADTRPAVAMPSIGSIRNAETATLHPAPRRRSRLAIAAVTAIAVGAAGSFALVRALRDDESASQAAAGPADDAAIRDHAIPDATLAAAPAVPDAGTPDGATVAAVDAGAGSAKPESEPARQDRDRDHTRDRPPSRTRFGGLRVVSDPIVTVFVDNKRYGDTPITIPKLPVGRRSLRLVNRDAIPPIDDRRTVVIRQGKVLQIVR